MDDVAKVAAGAWVCWREGVCIVCRGKPLPGDIEFATEAEAIRHAIFCDTELRDRLNKNLASLRRRRDHLLKGQTDDR